MMLIFVSVFVCSCFYVLALCIQTPCLFDMMQHDYYYSILGEQVSLLKKLSGGTRSGFAPRCLVSVRPVYYVLHLLHCSLTVCGTLYPRCHRLPAQGLTSRPAASILSTAADYLSELFSEPFSREAVQVEVDRIIEVSDNVKEILKKETQSKFISIFCFSVCIRERE